MDANELILDKNRLDKEFSNFEKRLSGFNGNERKEIMRALHWGQELHKFQKRASGEPYIIHPLKAAEIVLSMHLDKQTVIAALLHDVLEDTVIGEDKLVKEFGEEVAMLVDGVTKIDLMDVKDKTEQQIETLRKMMFAMSEDIRVIFIKLADKRHNMESLQYLPNHKQIRISRECLEIYAPLAGKLGINSIKRELEDLSLKYLNPESYSEIASHVAHKKAERKEYLHRAQNAIQAATAKLKIDVKVNTRAKHFYSIYRKVKDRGKDLSEIYDFLGLRILCKDTAACYTLLGIVHNLWKPINGRFKDYIAMPKQNGYQSLHTTVICYEQRHLEVQIRSYNMDETAKFGVAAHYIYKNRSKRKNSNLQKQDNTIMSRLATIKKGNYDSAEFFNTIKEDILQDTIIVFSPKGDPYELPRGATAIDFAYHIHSDVGNHMIQATANGNIIPLTRPLKHSETISITTRATAHPHQEWLKHAKSSRARSKIRQWLHKHDEEIISIEKNIIARTIKENKKNAPPKQISKKGKNIESPTRVVDKKKVGITIGNEKNMMIHIAGCCKPAIGDRIIGFVSQGRGIIVHRSNCKNLKGIPDFEERKIDVSWETPSSKHVRRFKILSKQSSNLFSELEGAIKKYRGHLLSGKISITERGNMEGIFIIETVREADFNQIRKNIRLVPSVLSLTRIDIPINDPDEYYNEGDFDD